MNKDEYWYLLIQGEYDKKGAFVNFYSHGEHLGDALNNTKNAALEIGLVNCELVEANHLDLLEDFELPEETVKLSNKVIYKNGFSTYELDNENDESFISPIGIVKSTEDGEIDFDEIKEQFEASGKDEDGVYSFCLSISKNNLEKVFFDSINFLPNINSIWIYIMDHWEFEKETELWINKDLTDKEDIVNFVKNNKKNLIHNGYLDLVMHCIEGETNLMIDEHKQIRLTTKNVDIFNKFGKEIMNLGFNQTRDYKSLENGFYHWHYRSNESLNKNKFREFLKINNFELIEKFE